VCFDQQEQDNLSARFKFYAIFLAISAFFLAATLFVYIFLKELRNLHGKILICHISSLLVGYSLLSIVQFTNVGAYHCAYICNISQSHLGLSNAELSFHSSCCSILWHDGQLFLAQRDVHQHMADVSVMLRL